MAEVVNTDKLTGELLLDQSIIVVEQLDKALKLQNKIGCKIGHILLSLGYIKDEELYRALALKNNLSFTDNLLKLKTDIDKHSSFENAIKQRYLVYNINGSKYAISCGENNLRKLKNELGKDINIKITTPFIFDSIIRENFQEKLEELSCYNLWRNHPEESAKSLAGKFSIFIGFIALILMCILLTSFSDNWESYTIGINIFYLANNFFKVFLLTISTITDRNKFGEALKKKSRMLNDRDLPLYTILLPTYREEYVIGNLVKAIGWLDYPKSKLDVIILVEKDDQKTLERLRSIDLPSYVKYVIIPDHYPKTKPKACNYGLQFAKGEYVTIFDADDIPDPMQLKLAITAISNSDEIICAQAKLSYYNKDENILTKLFSLEYSAWFDFMIPSLCELGIPIPLSGSSNHFKLEKLKKIKAWDPHNVTEDADLGMRIAKFGYKTELLESTTMEEAPDKISVWLNQRARWIKGFFQTYIVHSKNPLKSFKKLGLKGFLSLQLFIGLPCLTYLLSPFIWISAALCYLFDVKISPFLHNLQFFNLICFFLIPLTFSFAAIIKHKWTNLKYHALISPFYPILHWIAAFKAFCQLIKAPHHWNKTPHKGGFDFKGVPKEV